MKTKTIMFAAIATVGAVLRATSIFLAIGVWGMAISDKLWYVV